MRTTCASALIFVCCLSLHGCAVTNEQPEEETVAVTVAQAEPAERLIVVEEFGPLVYRIDPVHQARWDQVLELQDRLFKRQERKVGEDDRHRLYNAADADDDDILSAEEIEAAFRKMKREYERYLTHSS